MNRLRTLRWPGPPLALQIMALLVGGLIVAQLVTLVLTMLLPPAPAPQYELDDIAAALIGQDLPAHGRHRLQRVVQAGPPDLKGAGWLVSERSQRELAQMIGVGADRVTLAFYTPLPFAGSAVSAPVVAMADDGFAAPLATAYSGPASRPRLILADFHLPALSARATAAAPHDGFSSSLFSGNHPPPFANVPPNIPAGAAWPGAGTMPLAGRGRGLISVDPRPDNGHGVAIPGDDGVAVPALLRGAEPLIREEGAIADHGGDAAGRGALARQVQAGMRADLLPPQLLRDGSRVTGSPDRLPGVPGTPLFSDHTSITPAPAAPSRPQRPLVQPLLQPAPRVAPPLVAPLLPPQIVLPPPTLAPPAPIVSPAGPPIRVAPPGRALFGFAPAPFVEGDFVAALEMPDGRWSVVQPAPEPFPNSWQWRVLLWFAIALALVVPVGWLFARRLSKPLDRFADAAEQLGRDPGAVIGPLDGPAEIGRAARAFNLMQNRLRTFVDDRTAMVGAISHDLRTPLTRMRFRIEDVPDGVREGLLEEVDEMEAMIAQVIDFLRDASAPGARERLDLRTLVDDVVENARLVGGDVAIERAEPAPVEVDALGMRRVLDNLLENAVKYGVRARVRLRTEADDAVAEILDDGPGLPDDEIERAFEPFYRGERALASGKAGTGLGLAVCRSIARAHGGDIRLRRLPEGFAAEVRVPLAA